MRLVLKLHGEDNALEFFLLAVVGGNNLGALAQELLLKLVHVIFELLLEHLQALVLDLDQVVDVLDVAAQSHLVLILGLVEVAVEHLENSIAPVHLAAVSLCHDIDLLGELLGFGGSEFCAPFGHFEGDALARQFLFFIVSFLKRKFAHVFERNKHRLLTE